MNLCKNLGLLVGCTLLSGCQPSDSAGSSYSLQKYSPASLVPFSDIENVRIDELHNQPNNYVFAMNRDTSDLGRGAYWGTLDEFGWIRFYETGPKVSLFQVSYIAISDDDKYLAVETTGEGHAVLDVFQLQKWLSYSPRGGDIDTPPLEPIASLNPYPFSFRAEGWKGEYFVLSSTGRLDELRSRRQTGQSNFSDKELANEESYVFLWNIRHDQIERQQSSRSSK